MIDDIRQTMNEVLTGFITDFAGRLDGRSEYNASLEQWIDQVQPSP